MPKKIKFNITGMHCQSCKTLIEAEVKSLDGVERIEVDYQTGEGIVQYDENKLDENRIFKAIRNQGYEINDKISSVDNDKTNKAGKINKNYLIAGILLLVFLAGMFIIRYYSLFDLLSQVNDSQLGYGLIIIIGFLAGFHCVGMCGGFVIAYSAQAAKDNDVKKVLLKPHFYYNLGRVISYTVIGGILGSIGSFFAISSSFISAVILVAGIFMVLMGLSFFDNFRFLSKLKMHTPAFIAKYIFKESKNGSKSPFVIGLATGLMPCGPLQAMQLYALTTGHWAQGALVMAAFSIGTVPLMFGLGSFISVLGGNLVKKSLKFSGAIVVILGLLTIYRGIGNFQLQPSAKAKNTAINQEKINNNKDVQVVKMDLTYQGYKPSTLYVKKGVPVRWVINVIEMSGCTNAIILHGYDIEKKLKYGENIIEFTPKESGEIKFSCWMKMVWGKFVVN